MAVLNIAAHGIGSLGGILTTDKVVDNIGVTHALLNGLSVAQVVFLNQVR